MQENFLHFIWQHQYFNKKQLETTDGDLVNILKVGSHNLMSGPDFSEARIEIGEISWTGQVEIHLKSSDWDLHKHQTDPAYNNVILHVVWKADKEVFREDKTAPPTIELNERIDPALINRYEELISNPLEIPCENALARVERIEKMAMVEKALISRLENKSRQVLEILNKTGNDWEETSFQFLSRGFGLKDNTEPFYQLSRVLSIKTIQKHADNLFQIEALLFGQAGFLTGRTKDDYHRKLKDEFEFLKHKLQLQENMLKASVWKMGRLRPANFPTVRVSQLAASLSALKNVFSVLINTESLQNLRSLLRVKPSPYWDSHFVFGEKAARKSSVLGLESADRLVINVFVPILAAYSIYTDDRQYMDKAVATLQQIKPEKNGILRKWEKLDFVVSSSADSQGLIELYNNYCQERSCLSCNIGTAVLKKTKA